MTTWRLNPTDETLYAADRTLGSSRVVQVLWRFPRPVTREVLEAEWRRLDRGRLSRRAAPARLPAARRKWVPAANGEPPHSGTRELTGDDVPRWIDAQVRAPLPAGSAALWRLAAAPYRGGGLVSLTVPHFRADGMGIFDALAARDAPVPHGAAAEGADGDLGEAAGQVLRACGGAARWGLELLTAPGRRAQVRAALRAPVPPPAPGSAPRFFSSAVLDVPAADWERRAKEHGGTANSLFIEIAANLVRRHVPRGAHAPVDVGVPVSLRAPGGRDGRANALVVVPLTVPGGGGHHGDLRPTRRATRELLSRTGPEDATLVPEALWHLLPRRWAGRLKAPGAQQTDVIASNFGTVEEPVARFGDAVAESVALRTMNVPGLVPERARLRASLCLLRCGDRMTLTATGIPDHFGDAAALSRRVTAELADWGLTARQWWAPTLSEAQKES